MSLPCPCTRAVLVRRHQGGLAEGQVAVQADDVHPLLHRHVHDLQDEVGGKAREPVHEIRVLDVVVEEFLHASQEGPALAEGAGLHEHLCDGVAEVALRRHQHQELRGLRVVRLHVFQVAGPRDGAAHRRRLARLANVEHPAPAVFHVVLVDGLGVEKGERRDAVELELPHHGEQGAEQLDLLFSRHLLGELHGREVVGEEGGELYDGLLVEGHLPDRDPVRLAQGERLQHPLFAVHGRSFPRESNGARRSPRARVATPLPFHAYSITKRPRSSSRARGFDLNRFLKKR
jgi:hypothetical protein